MTAARVSWLDALEADAPAAIAAVRGIDAGRFLMHLEQLHAIASGFADEGVTAAAAGARGS